MSVNHQGERLSMVDEIGSGASDERARESLEGILEALHDPLETIRVEALEALSRLEDPQARPQIEGALQDASPLVRGAALVALVELGGRARASLRACVEALEDPETHVRQCAVRALGLLDGLAGEAAVRLARVALEDEDTATRELAKRTLGWARWTPEGAPLLALKAPHDPTRRAAAFLLGGSASPERIINPLHEALQDSSPEVRCRAAGSLVKLALRSERRLTTSQRERLRERLERRGTPAPEPALLLRVTDLRVMAAIPALEEALTLPSVEARLYTTRALRAIAAQIDEAGPGLVRALQDEAHEVTEEARAGLQEMGPRAEGVVAELACLLGAEDRRLRLDVAAILADVGEGARRAEPQLISLLAHPDAAPHAHGAALRGAIIHALGRVGGAASAEALRPAPPLEEEAWAEALRLLTWEARMGLGALNLEDAPWVRRVWASHLEALKSPTQRLHALRDLRRSASGLSSVIEGGEAWRAALLDPALEALDMLEARAPELEGLEGALERAEVALQRLKARLG